MTASVLKALNYGPTFHFGVALENKQEKKNGEKRFEHSMQK